MTKSIDTTRLIPLEVRAMGRSYVHEWQKSQRPGRPESYNNNEAYSYWWNLFYTAAVTRFEWKNIPDLIDPRAIEFLLFNYGSVGFFEMTPGAGDFAVAQAVPHGRMNMYGNPQEVTLIPINGGDDQTTDAPNWERNAYYRVSRGELIDPDCAMCWDNMLRKPIHPDITYICRRLARWDGIADINMRAQLTPIIVTADEEQKADALNYYNQIGGEAPVIFGSKRLDADIDVKAFKTDAPYNVSNILADSAKLVNRGYTFLGINNTNVEKRERIIEAEVDSNDEQYLIQRQAAWNCRKKFCEDVNKIFGLDIDVVWRVDEELKEKARQAMQQQQAGPGNEGSEAGGNGEE